MKRILQNLVVATVCGVSLVNWGSSTTQAQDPYWQNHWRWRLGWWSRLRLSPSDSRHQQEQKWNSFHSSPRRRVN